MGCPELKGIDMPSAGNLKDAVGKVDLKDAANKAQEINENGVGNVAGDMAG